MLFPQARFAEIAKIPQQHSRKTTHVSQRNLLGISEPAAREVNGNCGS